MSSITIYINDTSHTLAVGSTVAQLAAQCCDDDAPFAVAVNAHFIPKSHYHSTVLQHDDRVDILHPMQGG